MKFRHRVFLRVGTLILVLSAMAGIASSAFADGDSPRYEARVGDAVYDLTPGMEITQGSLLDDGSCEFPEPLVITGYPTEQENSGKVTTRVTEDCTLVVSDLEWRQVTNGSESGTAPGSLPVPGASGSSDETDETEEFIGYVDSSVSDWFPNIEVNSVEAGIQYFDNGSTVWGGHSEFHDWYWFTGSGWVKDSGTSGESTAGPNVISTWTEGEFHNDLCPSGEHCRTKHRGTFFTYPGDWRYHCTVYVIHPALRHSCSGERIEVAD